MTDHEPEPPPAETSEVAPDEAPEASQAGAALNALLRALGARPETTIAGDAVGRDKVVLDGDFVVQTVRSGPSRSSGEVPGEELQRNQQVFVASRSYDEAYDELRARHVVVLRGPQGTGRRSVALRLLSQLAKDDVVTLDPETEPERVVDHLRPGCGHHLASPVTSLGSPLRQVHLHAARRRLEQTNGYLVVTVEPETVVADVDFIVEWLSPDPAEVVRSHLANLVGAETIERLGLLGLEQTTEFLAGQPAPVEASGFARLLAAYADNRVEAGQLEDYGLGAASQHADAWFGGGNVPLREQAFVIALAVFDKSPYAEIAEPADDLFKRLQAVEDPEHAPRLEIFAASRSTRLRTARAREYDERVAGRWGLSPRPVCAFMNPVTAALVLERVWVEHPAAREPICEWLTALGESSAERIRLRVAVAAGILARADFDAVMKRLVTDWADSDRSQQRQLAVWALCTAAERGSMPGVRRVATEWSYSSERRQWVAARVYGSLGSSMLDIAFRRLGSMAEHRSGWLHEWNLAGSYAALLDGERAAGAFAKLDAAAQERGARGKVARQGFLLAARNLSVGDWPNVLRLAWADDDAWEQHARLWRSSLGDPELRDSARSALAFWVRVADGISDLESALARLVVDLADSENSAERLDYLLRRTVERDTNRTLPVAERLREHLRRNGSNGKTERTAS